MPLLPDFFDELRGGIRIDLRRQPAGKTQRHGGVGGVTLARQRERAVQIDGDTRDLRQLTALLRLRG